MHTLQWWLASYAISLLYTTLSDSGFCPPKVRRAYAMSPHRISTPSLCVNLRTIFLNSFLQRKFPRERRAMNKRMHYRIAEQCRLDKQVHIKGCGSLFVMRGWLALSLLSVFNCFPGSLLFVVFHSFLSTFSMCFFSWNTSSAGKHL